jgi:hypothetical protein
MKITIKNNLSEAGLFFMRGQNINGLYLDEKYTVNIVNNTKYDCTDQKKTLLLCPAPKYDILFQY